VVRRLTGPAILTEAARQENAIAGRVQSATLSGEVDVEGPAISAMMLPAEVAGGDDERGRPGRCYGTRQPMRDVAMTTSS
jgi:hypothetical protein